MRKLTMILVALLGIGVLAHLLAGGFYTVLPVKLYPATLYINGQKVEEGERKGYFDNGKEQVPAAIEYQGTMYVPLHLVGKHINQPVGWDPSSFTAWLGESPDKQPSRQGGQSASKVDSPAESSQTANRDGQTDGEKQITASEKSGKADPNQPSPPENQELFGLKLGDPAEQVTTLLGAPARREPSALGYEWWIYNQDPNKYLQVGIDDGKVVDLYSNAPQARIGQVAIGTSYQALSSTYRLNDKVTFAYRGAQVEITNLIKERPLVMEQDTALIFYIDKHNGDRVTAMRMINQLPLLQGGFYETKWTYRGQSPNFDPPPLSIKEREAIDAAHERQIIDLVNVIRYRYSLPRLSWHEKAAEVARKHSSDMEQHQFFDHVSATTGMDPFERLKQAGIPYKAAGENIAAGFVDAIEAHESWMNSLGHRKNVMEKAFTQLGVGVMNDYYTQNFLTPR